MNHGASDTTGQFNYLANTNFVQQVTRSFCFYRYNSDWSFRYLE